MNEQRDNPKMEEAGPAAAHVVRERAEETALRLINPAKGNFLARHTARLARTPEERAGFQRVLAAGYARVTELERLAADAHAVVKGDAVATGRFRETLFGAMRDGVRGKTRRAPDIDDPAAFARLFAGFGPCGGIRLLEPTAIASIRIAIDVLTSGNPALRERYRETLAGLWDRGRSLDRLYEDAIMEKPGRAAYVRRIAERIGAMGRVSNFGMDEIPPSEGDAVWPPPHGYDSPASLWPDEPPVPEIPDFCNQAQRLCEELVINGFNLRALPRSVYTTGITAVEPQGACPGETITIRGTGFGSSQPADVVVLVDVLVGEVTFWSDTVITVVVPALARSGCVGFRNETLESERRTLDELNRRDLRDLNVGLRCLGSGEQFPVLPYLEDLPDCIEANSVSILRARVLRFEINGQTEVTVAPGTPLRLSWATEGATEVLLQRVGANGPPVPAGGQPPSGFADLGPLTANRPGTATYVITAQSRCRTEPAEVRAIIFQPGTLAIVGLELVQGIQTWDVSNPALQNSVRLAAEKTTVARIFVDFDGFGFHYGTGAGDAPRVAGEVRFTRPGGGSSFTVPIETFIDLPTGRLLNRANRSGSLIAIIRPAAASEPLEGIWEVSVTVEATMVDGRRIASASLPAQPFTFHVRREVWFVAYRVRDIANNLNPPTEAEVIRSMRANIDRLPLADSDAMPVIFRPLLITEHDFTLMDGKKPDREPWEDMLDDLEDVAYWNRVTPLARRRGTPLVTYCAFLPNPPLGYNGIGGIANFNDPYLVAITLPGGPIIAHEFGHTLDLNHAPVPGTPADEVDSRLVATTEDHGFDSGPDGGPGGSLVQQGTDDIMAAFSGNGVSIRTWNYIFDEIGAP